MINEADLMQKMEMFIHMNHRARAMHGGCGPKHMPHGPYGPGCRQGGPRHMPMPGMPVPPMPRPMLGRERLLVLIGKSEGGVRQKDLLEKVHIGAPAMSELINKLEDDGYTASSPPSPPSAMKKKKHCPRSLTSCFCREHKTPGAFANGMFA